MICTWKSLLYCWEQKRDGWMSNGFKVSSFFGILNLFSTLLPSHMGVVNVVDVMGTYAGNGWVPFLHNLAWLCVQCISHNPNSNVILKTIFQSKSLGIVYCSSSAGIRWSVSSFFVYLTPKSSTIKLNIVPLILCLKSSGVYPAPCSFKCFTSWM